MSKRLQRVNELLKRELSSVIQREFEFKDCLVTITAVEVTQDLKEAKVFVSVLGPGLGTVMTKLKEKRALIQSRVTKRVVLKNTPVLDFRSDSAAERGIEIVSLLEEVDKIPTAPPAEDEEPSE